MPTQVDDIQALITDIKTNTKNTADYTLATSNNTLALLFACQSGFTNLANGMQIQISLQQQTNSLLFINDKQNQLIICWLKNIAEELCKMLNLNKDQVELQSEMSEALTNINSIIKMIHSKEALEIIQLNNLQKQIEKCCPPEKSEREPCFKPCDKSPDPDYKELEIHWEPIKFDIG